jgi:hypothetical protein
VAADFCKGMAFLDDVVIFMLVIRSIMQPCHAACFQNSVRIMFAAMLHVVGGALLLGRAQGIRPGCQLEQSEHVSVPFT